MRVIDAFNRAVQALAVSPDGRYLAAAAENALAVWSWGDARVVWWSRWSDPIDQLGFTPNGLWLAVGGQNLKVVTTHDGQRFLAAGQCAGGTAFAPDGKHFVASEEAPWGDYGRLLRWTVPDWKPVTGFDYWPGFTRLAFSPDGQYLAGINPTRFELRIAVTGGLNGWGRWIPRVFTVKRRDGTKAEIPEKQSESSFLTFSRDSQTFVAGWDTQFDVLDTVTGTLRRAVRSLDVPIRDAAFTGSGRYLGTVGDTGAVQFWDAGAWQVVRTYDWRAGPLTRVAFTADGLAGVCGTKAGQLVVFDIDE